MRLRPFRVRICLLFAVLLIASACFALLRWDAAVSDAVRSRGIHGNPALAGFVDCIKGFGKGDVVILLGLLIGIGGFTRRGLEIIVAVVLVAALVWPVKLAVHRARPGGGQEHVSFPSGDAAATAAMAVPVVLESSGVLPVAGLLVLAVGAGRIVNDAHYASDILGGAAVGLAAGALAVLLCRRVRRRLRMRHFVLAAAPFLAGWLGIYSLGKGGTECARFLAVFGPALLLGLASRLFEGTARRAWKAVSADSFPGRNRRFAVRLAPLLVAAAVFGAYLFAASRSTLWDRDEPRFARATVEMMESGNWLVPTFNGEPRLHKPALLHWLMAAPVRLLGRSEAAVRFVSPVAAAATCLLVHRIGASLFGRAAGLLAMAMVATTPLMMVNGTVATTDALLLFFITASMAVFRGRVPGRPAPSRVALLGALLGAAQLTKGPVGLAVPVLSMIAASWLGTRKDRPREPQGLLKALPAATAIGLLVFAFWIVPANEATDGAFVRVGFGHHVVHRSLTPMEGHGGGFLRSLPFYLPVILLGFFPWVLFLPGAISALLGGRLGGERPRSFLAGWAVPTVVLMTLVATKLPHYILPIWPALALMTAGTVAAADGGTLAPRDMRWLRHGAWLLAVPGTALALSLAIGPWILPFPALRMDGFSAGALLLVMTAAAVREQLKARPLRAAAVLIAGMVLFQLLLAGRLLPALSAYKPSAPLARAIRAGTPPGVPVAAYGYGEPSLVFYVDRGPVAFLGSEEDVVSWAGASRPGVLVIPRGSLRDIERRRGPLGLREIASAAGFDFAKGRALELVALGRGGPPR